MTLLIENARSDDAAAIAEVHVRGLQTTYENVVPNELLDPAKVEGRARQWQGWIRRNRARTSVARVDGAVAGFLAVHPAPGEVDGALEIAALFVAPECWGQGIATKLWGHALSGDFFDEAAPIYAWVLESNEGAKRFYAGRGLKPDGVSRIVSERADGPVYELRYWRVVR